jgi:hypothetical protein
MKTTNSESCKSVNNNTLRNKYCFYFKIVRVNSFVPNLYSDRYVTVDSGLLWWIISSTEKYQFYY